MTTRDEQNKKRGKKRIFLIISLIIGLLLFVFFIIGLGKSAVILISQNLNFYYLGVYTIITTFAFFPITWRWQVILKAHDEKVGFFRLLKQTIAGYAISYITPAVRIGGEPLRAYMLKKESNIDLKTGTSSIIIDKYVELFGSIIFALVGFILILFIPISWIFKITLAILILIILIPLVLFYYRTIRGNGSFSSIFILFRLSKFSKSGKILPALKAMENKMQIFFKEHKKALFIAFLFYAFTGIIFVFEFKYLFLGFGVELSIIELILMITLLGFINLIPIPASLGILEAGQSGLFCLLKNNPSIGLAFSLLVRIRNFAFVALGFLLISHFTGFQILRDFKNQKLEIQESENNQEYEKINS